MTTEERRARMKEIVSQAQGIVSGIGGSEAQVKCAPLIKEANALIKEANADIEKRTGMKGRMPRVTVMTDFLRFRLPA